MKFSPVCAYDVADGEQLRRKWAALKVSSLDGVGTELVPENETICVLLAGQLQRFQDGCGDIVIR